MVVGFRLFVFTVDSSFVKTDSGVEYKKDWIIAFLAVSYTSSSLWLLLRVVLLLPLVLLTVIPRKNLSATVLAPKFRLPDPYCCCCVRWYLFRCRYCHDLVQRVYFNILARSVHKRRLRLLSGLQMIL
ncbi:MAG: hypothetical protein EZS28_008846 [Streblomastix strix]|uniref:Uncharacterized protein n=1 Tax=Streblomastix strix TaxID=222440 RepID=A0A5J4WM34_9EUKA|nr:MAG: hypothetical protein EZS28_008846 [Streblomastix strix]